MHFHERQGGVRLGPGDGRGRDLPVEVLRPDAEDDRRRLLRSSQPARRTDAAGRARLHPVHHPVSTRFRPEARTRHYSHSQVRGNQKLD